MTAMVINFFCTFVKYFVVVFSKAKNSDTELFTLIEATCLLVMTTVWRTKLSFWKKGRNTTCKDPVRKFYLPIHWSNNQPQHKPRCGPWGFKSKQNICTKPDRMRPVSSTSMGFLCIIFLLLVSSGARGDNSETAYEVLQEYDFPIGLLPKSVLGYTIDRTTGKFSVYLEDTCSFSIESYDLKYKPTITGVITKGKISDLSGISVKVLILWLNIVEVTRQGDELMLSVGIASADFPVSSFAERPTCGCGFDCFTATANNLRFTPNVLSSIS